MDKKIYSIYSSIQNNWCSGCDGDCNLCFVEELLENVKKLDLTATSDLSETEGCFVCLDKRGKTKEVFYDSGRGGLGVAIYCPNCGRKI